MPSETVNFPGFFADDASLPSEINGFWKSDNLPNDYATGRKVARSPLEHLGAIECQPAKSLELYQSLMQDQKMNQSRGMQAVGTDKAFHNSLVMLRPARDSGIRSSLNVQQTHYYTEGDKVDNLTTQNGNSLFSRSFSELASRKVRLSSNNVPCDRSVDTFAFHVEEEEPLESLEEIEAQTIGNLLPTDDDLFNEMTDKMNHIQQSSGKDDIEELDVFSSLGGLDLGDDGSVAQNNNGFHVGVPNDKSRYRNGSLVEEHPYSVLPSRTLFARNINSSIEDSELRALFEQYGDIQTFDSSCKHRGFVMISYYDIRAAMKAKQALHNIPLRHCKLDLHYSIPKDEDINQGVLVVLNLDSSIVNDELRQIFWAFGEIKEIRETSHRSQHRYIEFFDFRAADAAFRALNGSNIAGKKINLELSRAGGSRCLLRQVPSDFEQDECRPYAVQSSPCCISTAGYPGTVLHGGIISSSLDDGTISKFSSAKQSTFMESLFGHGISSSVPNRMSSLLRVDSSANQTGFAEPGQLKYNIQGTPNFHPHSLPDNYDNLKSIMQSMSLMPSERTDNRKLHKVGSNGHLVEFDDGGFGTAVNGSFSLTGHHYAWGNSHNPHSPGVMWSNSPAFVNGISVASPTERLHGSSGLPSVVSSVLPVNNHHVGSAPSASRSLWERRHGYAGKSSDTEGFRSGSLGSLRVSNNSVSMELVSPPNMLPHVAGNYMELSMPPKHAGFQLHHQRSPMRSPLRSPIRSPIYTGRGQMSPMGNSYESPNERARSRRNEGSINPADKKQYELDLDRILQGEDKRTTLMIKNIPNKYTSKMLLAAIDEHHRGTYDFIYLPIDFKNKCNVGYAFINMIDPCQIVPFYKAFNGKKWEKFNSEKIASIAYARIQGKAALVTHFQNSSLMNEDKRCRPILFNSDGPNAGDQVPFPAGINVRTRPAKTKTSVQEENQLASSEESLNGDTSSGSGRDSD